MRVSSTSVPASRSSRARIFLASVGISISHLTKHLYRSHPHSRSLYNGPLYRSLALPKRAFIPRIASQKVVLQHVCAIGKVVIDRKKVGHEPRFDAIVFLMIGKAGL